MKAFVVIVAAIALASCHRHALPQSSTKVQNSDSVTVMYFYHDTVITPAPAVAAIHDTIPCPGWNYDTTVVDNHQRISVNAHNGKLNVTCATDSLQQVIKVLSQKITEVQRTRTDSTIVVTNTVKVPVTHIPGMMWWSIGLNVLLGAGLYFSWSTGISGLFSGVGRLFSKIKL